MTLLPPFLNWPTSIFQVSSCFSQLYMTSTCNFLGSCESSGLDPVWMQENDAGLGQIKLLQESCSCLRW